MSEHPLEQLDPQVLGSGSSNSTIRIRKRKLHEFFGGPKSKSRDAKPIGSTQVLYFQPPLQQLSRKSCVVSQALRRQPLRGLSFCYPG
ncbi:hypothetical protein BGZ95_008846, partial [Linnemannia exigua]